MPYDQNNVFARIIRGEIPARKTTENDHALAFPDIQPQAPAHVLVIPKGPYATLTDFAEKASDTELAAWVRAIGAAAKAAGVAEGGYRLIVNVGENGHQEVPHLHGHVLGGRPIGPMVRQPKA